MLPRTWEDPTHPNAELGGVLGDNDPVDLVEIGSAALASGSVVPVKVLAVYSMIDDGGSVHLSSHVVHLLSTGPPSTPPPPIPPTPAPHQASSTGRSSASALLTPSPPR